MKRSSSSASLKGCSTGMTRGDVYRIKLPRGRGHAQREARYGVVVQAYEFIGLSKVIVAPTSRSAVAASFRPVVEIDGTRTRVLVEQLRALDLRMLGRQAGCVAPGEQAAVDEAPE